MTHRSQLAKKTGLIGAGVGLALFALFGLLEGSLIGGTVGLGIVNSFVGAQEDLTLLSRAVVAASMLTGVILAGIICVVLSSSAGWAMGYVIGWLSEPKAVPSEMDKTGHGVIK